MKRAEGSYRVDLTNLVDWKGEPVRSMVATCSVCGAELVMRLESEAQETSVRRTLEDAGRMHLLEAHGVR